MFCTNCGREVPEGKAFCPSCGTHVGGTIGQAGADQTAYAGYTSQAQAVGGQMPAYDPNQVRFQNTFVDQEEKFLGEMGDGYFKGTLSSPFGVAKKCSAVVTDKRVYLQGKMLDASQGRLNAFSWVKTVGVKDITGTGFVASNPIGLLIVSIIYGVLALFSYLVAMDAWGGEKRVFMLFGTIMLVLAIVLLLIYLFRRKIFFVIEYAGGRIQFNATLVGYERVRAFQHLIIRAKDAAQK